MPILAVALRLFYLLLFVFFLLPPFVSQLAQVVPALLPQHAPGLLPFPSWFSPPRPSFCPIPLEFFWPEPLSIFSLVLVAYWLLPIVSPSLTKQFRLPTPKPFQLLSALQAPWLPFWLFQEAFAWTSFQQLPSTYRQGPSFGALLPQPSSTTPFYHGLVFLSFSSFLLQFLLLFSLKLSSWVQPKLSSLLSPFLKPIVSLWPVSEELQPWHQVLFVLFNDLFSYGPRQHLWFSMRASFGPWPWGQQGLRL